jgi:hypothetical protein
MNRSTIYEFLQNETELIYTSLNIGKGKYIVFMTPWAWENSYLLINNMRFTDFHSLILFSNELVVRFDKYLDQQVNIPYKDIEILFQGTKHYTLKTTF